MDPKRAESMCGVIFQCNFPVFNSRPAGHGPVCTDEIHAVIFSQAKAGDHQNSLQQIQACEIFKWDAEQGRGEDPSAPETCTF